VVHRRQQNSNALKWQAIATSFSCDQSDLSGRRFHLEHDLRAVTVAIAIRMLVILVQSEARCRLPPRWKDAQCAQSLVVSLHKNSPGEQAIWHDR